MNDDRYLRQRRLAEIGDAGQERIAAARAEVRGLDGADIEIRYLAGAGLRDITHDPNASPLPFLHEPHFRFASTRRVAAGAWRALGTLKRALEAPP
jgi:hypothetical protein